MFIHVYNINIYMILIHERAREMQISYRINYHQWGRIVVIRIAISDDRYRRLTRSSRIIITKI